MAIPRWRIFVAFAALYLIWGSAYLAIQIAIETLPPLLSSAIRFLFAGILLLVWAFSRGLPRPTSQQIRLSFTSGAFMFLISNGGIVWATQFVPSSIVALMNATIPLWMVLMGWLMYHNARPGLVLMSGLLTGIFGMLLLIGPDLLASGTGLYPPAVLALIIAPLGWSFGSMLSRERLNGTDPLLLASLQLLFGGVLLLVFGLLIGERLDFASVTLRSWGALLYLATGSSVIAFGAFHWLLRVDHPARVATYALVNPIVALFLGVLLAGEPLTSRTLTAAAVILTGVLIIIYHRSLSLALKPRLIRKRYHLP